MSKKILLTIISLALVMLMAFSSMFIVSAVDAIDETVPGDFTEETTDTEETEETETTEDPNNPYKAGDINADGEIDINDVTIYQLTLVGKQEVTPAFERNGDTVLDAKKNIKDATGIQYYVAKIFKILPVTTDGYYAPIIRP